MDVHRVLDSRVLWSEVWRNDNKRRSSEAYYYALPAPTSDMAEAQPAVGQCNLTMLDKLDRSVTHRLLQCGLREADVLARWNELREYMVREWDAMLALQQQESASADDDGSRSGSSDDEVVTCSSEDG